jgi:DNA-binding IclR family transcriptional regulator
MAGNSREEGRSVTDKVIAIMRAFTEDDELSNVEIARLAGLPVSTAHRLLNELVVGGMLERTHRRHYRVGPTARAIATRRSTRAGKRGDGSLTTISDVAG